jgi:hypothetical protein
MLVLGGVRILMSKVPLYRRIPSEFSARRPSRADTLFFVCLNLKAQIFEICLSAQEPSNFYYSIAF